jgi:hypothetical protein
MARSLYKALLMQHQPPAEHKFLNCMPVCTGYWLFTTQTTILLELQYHYSHFFCLIIFLRVTI